MEIEKKLHPLLRRAILYLESGDWGKADDYCERCLDEEPENAYAYVIKIMARVKVTKEEDLALANASYREWFSFKNAYRFADDQLKARLDDYIFCVEKRIADREAATLASIEEKEKSEEKKRCEQVYNSAKSQEMTGTKYYINSAIELYKSIPGYKDSDERILMCYKSLAELETKKKADLAKLKDIRKKKQQKKFIITFIVLFLLAVAIGFFVGGVIENNGQRAINIKEQLIGNSYHGSYLSTLNTTGGEGLKLATEIEEVETTYVFVDDHNVEIEVIRRYDEEPFLSQDGKRLWDSEDRHTDYATWGEIKLSLFGKATMMIDGEKYEIILGWNDNPKAIKNGDDEYALQ